MLIRLLGAFFPNTRAGTMNGNPIVAAVNVAAFTEDSINFLLDIRDVVLFVDIAQKV
jgi:hypothetical protein